jgi:uncharacterized membrane protein
MDDAERERADRQRFARRLEAFSDIVFGFALAQCAFALEVPKTLADFSGSAGDLAFFAITFAIIAMFWTMHYRVFHYVFAGERTDVLCNFALLGAVALLPYALRLYLKFPQSVPGSVAYAAALAAGFGLLAVLELRGLRAHGAALPAKPRAIIERAARRHGVVGSVFAVSLALFPFLGTDARYVWVLIAPAIVIVRLVERSQARTAGAPVTAKP